MRYLKLSEFGFVIMGMSPSGETYNEKGEGLPLLNGPTEFTNTCPIPKLYTIDSKRECKEGDLIFCVRGSTTGKMNWSDQIYSIGRGVCAIRGKSRIDTLYVRYCIEHNLQGLLSVAGGGTFPNLKKDDIGNFEIPIIDNRKKIVEILSTYDDLIENNLKRIKLLEETAQNIYKEWFVNFRFPNYEHTEFDIESGLPVGWKMKKLSELNNKITDGTHDSPKPTENGFPLITGKNLINGFVDFSNSYLISPEDHEKIKSRSYLDIGDIMYSNIGTVGSTAIVSENFEYSCKNVIIFKPFTEYTNFLYCFLTNDMNKKLFLQGLLGSNQKFISLKYAREYKFGFPNSDLILDFGLKTKSIFENRRCLFEMNQKLKEARDILLPRLMNRTIEV